MKEKGLSMTPENIALLDAIEERLAPRFEAIDKKIDDMGERLDKRIDDMGERLDRRIDDMSERLDKKIDRNYETLDQLFLYLDERRAEDSERVIKLERRINAR